MKKILSFILIMILCIALFGCTAVPSLPSETAAPQDSAPAPSGEGTPTPAGNDDTDEVSLPEEAGSGQIIIKIYNSDIQEYYAPDDSGKLLLSYVCEKPAVEIENNEYATDTINNYFNDLDEEYYTGENRGHGNVFGPGFNQMRQKALDNYSIAIDYDTDIRLDLVFSHYVDILRCDNRVISFVFTDYLYDGTSSSGEYYKYALCFDVFSGELIDIKTSGDYSKIRKTVNRNVAEYSELTYDVGTWYLDGTGLTFILKNEEGNYKTSAVPYEAFSNVGSAFMTAPGKYLPGTVTVADTAAENSDLPILDRIDADPVGAQFFLTVEGTVYDFKLINVQYSNYEEMFYSKNVYWMTNYISDARIQLSLDIPDGMPNMMLSYTSEGVEYSRFITQSGYDGHVILIDTDINAVG